MAALKENHGISDGFVDSRLSKDDQHFVKYMIHSSMSIYSSVFDTRKLLDGAEDFVHLKTFRALLTSMLVESSGLRGWAENCRQIDYIPASEEEFEGVIAKAGRIRFNAQTYIDLCSGLNLSKIYLMTHGEMHLMRDMIDGLVSEIEEQIEARYYK